MRISTRISGRHAKQVAQYRPSRPVAVALGAAAADLAARFGVALLARRLGYSYTDRNGARQVTPFAQITSQVAGVTAFALVTMAGKPAGSPQRAK
jgi:hypothetical protein